MKGPVPALAAVYICGILLGHWLGGSLPLLFVGTFALGGAAWWITAARPALLWAFILFCGWTNVAWRSAALAPHDLRHILGHTIEDARLRGRTVESARPRLLDNPEATRWRSTVELEIDSLARNGEWIPARGRVSAGSPGILLLYAGQRIEVNGILRPAPAAVAPGQFDAAKQLRVRGIYYQLQVEREEDWLLLSAENNRLKPPLPDRFRTWAQSTLTHGLPEEDQAVHLLWAMVLGWRTALSGEVREDFMRSGTLHIFAISGLHVGLISGILVGLLRVLRVPRSFCGCFAIPALWFYAAATGWQSSAVRATLMMSIIIAGWALKRPPDLVNSLGAAALIILLWEPRQLFHPGFQLSFCVVLSIAWVAPLIGRLERRWLESDPLLPPELRPLWQRRLDRPLRFLAGGMAASLAAWLGSLPLVACYFHLVTPVAIVANLVIVHLSALALMSSLGSLLCGAWLPVLTSLFNHSAWFWMSCMIRLSEWTASWPGAYSYVRAPSVLQALIYYGLLAGILSGWFFERKRRHWVCPGVALLLLVFALHARAARDEIRITVLPVSGDAIFVDAPGWTNDLLVDCGNESSARHLVKPFLRSQGVGRLPALLLTHGDVHHVGGAELLEREFAPVKMITSPVRFRSPVYRKILSRWEASPGKWQTVARGDQIGPWTVLHPEPRERVAQADDGALVLRGTFPGASVLMMSDLGQLGQRLLFEREQSLAAEIVIAGMPAKFEPLHDALLEKIRPRLVIISCAASPPSERASAQLRERLNRRGVPVIYTADSGAVLVRIRKDGWKISTSKGERFWGGKSLEQIRIGKGEPPPREFWPLF